MKILLIEDDQETAALILRGLRDSGHDISVIDNGKEGLHEAMHDGWDLLIVDRLLPELDGLSLIVKVREAGNKIPVLFLTALGGIDDRVQGFDAGGDDYLVKPFAFRELAARINALHRRSSLRQDMFLNVGSLKMDLIKRKVYNGDQLIELFPQEFRLLEYFMRHAGNIVTRTMLLENVWELNIDPGTNLIESHVSRLRSKLSQDIEDELISTIRGTGYRLNGLV